MSPEQRQAVRDVIKRNGGPSVVARLCGVTVSTTCRWKSGKVRMPAMAVRLLEAIERMEA